MLNRAATALPPYVRSGIVVDQLDRELERQGHQFRRYARNWNIYVLSDGAG